ncbi:MAG: cyclic nucleotide-binding domain-containing protein [Chloroflexi bacterium]|nr:cyclic nucleotide-binding domain-containing protein [Chloroflexota bacterium]
MNQDESLRNVNILKSVSYFSGLDAAALNLVAGSAIRRAYDAGQVVLIEGEPCAGLYIVESGWLKAVKIGLDGREQVLQMLRAGEAFNAISVFTNVPNQATVSALEDSVAWLVPARDSIEVDG